MYFKEFVKRINSNICRTQIEEQIEFYKHKIILSEDGRIFIDFKETQLSSIKEAISHINQTRFEDEIAKELYEDIPSIKIANLIKEHHEIKITNKLIESYINLASSKTFSVDPVVTGIRAFNSIDNINNDLIDYVLNDGSSVAISESTQSVLNHILENKYQVVEYMRESKDNFKHVLRELS